MSKKRQEGIDPAVLAALTQDEKKRVARGQKVPTEKTTVTLPANLVKAIREEAFSLTGHRRRGFSEFMTVLLQYAWEAYQAGNLEIETQPAAVALRIMAAKK